MAMIVYGTRRLVSDLVVVYSFSPTNDPEAITGIAITDPTDLNGMKVFPLNASTIHGQAVLGVAHREFERTGEWPETVSHFS